MRDIQKLIDEVSVGQISANDIVSTLEDIDSDFDQLEAEKEVVETNYTDLSDELEELKSDFENISDELASANVQIDELIEKCED